MKINAMKLRILAAENGLSFGTVCKARAVKDVTERTVVKLARALQVDASELISQGER